MIFWGGIWILYLFALTWKLRRIPVFESIQASPRSESVSIVVAVKDQADSLEQSLHNFLEVKGMTELIVVNDRSTDQTAEILKTAAARDFRIKILTIDTLPPGWLGKVNALHQGTPLATGKYILFTDGDVLLQPECLARMVTWMENHHLDHLTAFPFVCSPSLITRALTLAIGNGMISQWIACKWRPTLASGDLIGIGAFNAVKRESFFKTDGWEWLRQEIIEDAGLSILMARHGFKTGILMSRSDIQFAWYPSALGFARGVQKNIFSGAAQFSLLRAFIRSAFQLAWVAAFFWLPFSTPPLFWQVVYVLFVLQSVYVSRRFSQFLGIALLFPVAVVALTFFLLWAAIKTSYTRRIEWRGTFYSLADLKAGKRFW